LERVWVVGGEELVGGGEGEGEGQVAGKGEAEHYTEEGDKTTAEEEPKELLRSEEQRAERQPVKTELWTQTTSTFDPESETASGSGSLISSHQS
jgi:hypothetical protein